MPDTPLGYFLTFTCYGARLHGDERDSVDRQHNTFGTPYLPVDPERNAIERARMIEPPLLLDAPQRHIVLATIREVCFHRSWVLLAAQVRSTHVHCLTTGSALPSKMIGDFKKYATRRLRESGLHRQRMWADHGSTRYVWRLESLERIAQYIVEEQGEALAVFDGRKADQSEPAQ